MTKKIGYTTGVFDLFHIGHLNILRRAKHQCDHLIVGVNSDNLTKQYKGKTPIIKQEERLEIVSAIKYVDEADICDSLDKIKAWETYHYNVLFQGSDWQNSPLYLSTMSFLNKQGGEIVLFDYTQTTSSTLLTNVLELFVQHESTNLI
jgi:glycerol-3-phosphate cytidylyltransferase